MRHATSAASAAPPRFGRPVRAAPAGRSGFRVSTRRTSLASSPIPTGHLGAAVPPSTTMTKIAWTHCDRITADHGRDDHPLEGTLRRLRTLRARQRPPQLAAQASGQRRRLLRTGSICSDDGDTHRGGQTLTQAEQSQGRPKSHQEAPRQDGACETGGSERQPDRAAGEDASANLGRFSQLQRCTSAAAFPNPANVANLPEPQPGRELRDQSRQAHTQT